MRRGRTGQARMSMEEFRRRFPAEAARLDAQDARRGGLPIEAVTKGKAWSAAKPTQAYWITGQLVTFASKTEARVAERLVAEVLAQQKLDKERGLIQTRLYRQVRIPLFSIEARDDVRGKGVPYYLEVDFVIVYPDKRRRYIDAKKKRKSPEWARGRAAAKAELGINVEEVER